MRRGDLLLDIALIAAAVYRQPGGSICRFRALDGLLLSHDCELCYIAMVFYHLFVFPTVFVSCVMAASAGAGVFVA